MLESKREEVGNKCGNVVCSRRWPIKRNQLSNIPRWPLNERNTDGEEREAESVEKEPE